MALNHTKGDNYPPSTSFSQGNDFWRRDQVNYFTEINVLRLYPSSSSSCSFILHYVLMFLEFKSLVIKLFKIPLICVPSTISYPVEKISTIQWRRPTPVNGALNCWFRLCFHIGLWPEHDTVKSIVFASTQTELFEMFVRTTLGS